MKEKYRLILFATILAIIFTTLSFLIPKYSLLWLSLEVIILPVVYIIGYEMLMDKQRSEFSCRLDKISEYSRQLEKENNDLKIRWSVQNRGFLYTTCNRRIL